MEPTKIYVGPDGTSFDHNIYFKHQIYDSIYKIEEDIEETLKYINDTKAELKILIAMDSRLIIEEAKYNEQDIHQFINNKIDELTDWLQENYVKLYRLNILLDKFKYNNPEVIKEIFD